jgi:membrane associated rhomboid family serine protease
LGYGGVPVVAWFGAHSKKRVGMRFPNTGQTATPAAVAVNPAPASGSRTTQSSGATAPQQPNGGQNRLREVVDAIPLATLFLLVVNVAVYGLTVAVPLNIGEYAISAYLVAYKLELHRMITAAFLHGGLMHVGMNMMTLYYIGAALERLFGTIQFFLMSWLFVLLVGAAYVGSSLVLAFVIFRDISWCVLALQPLIRCPPFSANLLDFRLYMSAVGYSGVLFAYAAQESMLGGGSHRSLFGFVNIPVKYYPWAMLLAMQIMIENVSFVGHLGGLLIGLAHVRCVGVHASSPVSVIVGCGDCLVLACAAAGLTGCSHPGKLSKPLRPRSGWTS